MAKSIMIKAKAFCESNKYRLSKPREYVLKIITENILYQEIITYIFFFLSFLIMTFIYHLNKLDFIYLTYFFLISLILWPLMQEYFDPIIFILAFSIFKSIRYFNKSNSIFLFSYYFIFLIIANIHYN